jgi:IPT/TIG domain
MLKNILKREFSSRRLGSLLCAGILYPTALLSGCGGGGGGTSTPPLRPDFSLGLNTSSLAIAPGATLQTMVSITALNGFSSSATVQITGLPAGVTASTSSLTVSASSPQMVSFSANSVDDPLTGTVVFTATSGSLTHTANLALQVTPRPFAGNFFMTLPGAETIGRPTLSAAYNANLKEVFYSDANFNSVEVFSTVDGHKVGEVSIPAPAGLQFSPDFSKLYVGTITPSVYVVDPAALHVVQQIAVPLSLTTPVAPPFGTEMPVMPYPMADGTVLMGMGVTVESSNMESFPLEVFDLVRYDPVAQTFTLADPGPSNLGGNPARSSDGNYLFVYGFESTNGYGLEIYSAASRKYLSVFGQVQNVGVLLAANQNGSQYATVEEVAPYGPGNAQIKFWGANLQPQPQSYTLNATVSAAIYSRDGKYLYLPTNAGYVAVLDTQAGTPVGYIGFTLTQSFFNTTLLDVDETHHLFGGTTGGGFILNASQPAATPPAAIPDFATATSGTNAFVGPLAGGTQVQFVPAPDGPGNADGITNTMEAYFGSTPATQDMVAPFASSSNGENALTATAPPATTGGPVSISLTDVSGNVVFLPNAFTYGPKILSLQPSVAGAAGGDSVTIFAYGLSFGLSDIHVTIGGTAVDMTNATLNSNISTMFPEASVTFPVPAGTPGWADVQITTSNGTDTLKRGLQYLTAETQVAGGPFSYAVYDTVRNLFYLTGNGSTVSVFNAGTQTMGSALTSNSVSSGATLQQLAITPDASKLLVVDPTDQAIVVFDLAGGTSKKVGVVLPSDPASTSIQPVNVSVATGGRAFVGMTPCMPLREINLASMTVQGRTDLSLDCSAPYPEFGAASADGSTIVYATSSGTQYGEGPSGPDYVWRYNASSDAFSGPVIFNDEPWMLGPQPTVDGDGGVVAVPQGVLDAQQLPKANILTPGVSAELNGNGSILYGVGTTGTQVVLSDTHNGRILLMLQARDDSATGGSGFERLAIDPTGAKILVSLQSGLVYFDLNVVPLSVGTIRPAVAASGTTVQVSGSGFVTGTTVTIRGLTTKCSFVDAQTLSCTVPTLGSGSAPISLSNPDGQTYSFENALVIP